MRFLILHIIYAGPMPYNLKVIGSINVRYRTVIKKLQFLESSRRTYACG